MMRQGIVVDTHPQDNSVDIVMADTGERLVGVKVLTTSGSSSRTGGIDLPEIQMRANKWDISKSTDQDVWAAVGYIGRQPVVSGFIYPPKNQMGITDKRTMHRRHQSDVQWSIDGDGNVQLQHPGGAYIRIGENPDSTPVVTAQPSATDRNTGRKVNVRIGLSGNAVVVTLTPEGDMRVTLDRDMDIQAQGAMHMAAQREIVIEAEGDISVRSSANVAVEADGNVDVSAGGNASLSVGGDVALKTSGAASLACTSATVNASDSVRLNTPLLSVSGNVIARDFYKRS